jgi:hypothetical protein
MPADDVGHSACGIPGEAGWSGADELLIELSRLLEGGGCQWLEEAICPGTINREQFAQGEASAGESGCAVVDPSSSVSSVQKPGHTGRYMGGERCVYCMWFGPDQAERGGGECTHVIRAVKEWRAQDSPSIQPGSLLQIVSVGFARKDLSSDIGCGARQFASHLRWTRLHRRHRKRRLEEVETFDSISAASLYTCSDDKPVV